MRTLSSLAYLFYANKRQLSQLAVSHVFDLYFVKVSIFILLKISQFTYVSMAA